MSQGQRIWDPDGGRPHVRLLKNVHRAMPAGSVLVVFAKKSDAVRRDNGVSLARARELIQRGHAELVGSVPLPQGDTT